MSKWSKNELLCNVRGLDDGYMFLHSSHPLAPKLNQILKNSKNPKLKYRLTDAASYGCPGFTGLLRPPLSNEIMPEGQVVSAPKISSKTIMSSEDNLFTEDISKNNCICVAFSEPAKLSHKSIMLPGTQHPPPSLNEEDKRICRPRLNRGGQSIAFMGGSDTRHSHKSGHGSMNISTYEREIAQRNGRGHDMNKAGTRSWGSFEPTSTRIFRGSNPFQRSGNSIPPPPPPPPPQKSSWYHHHSRSGIQHQQNQQQHMRHPSYSDSSNQSKRPSTRHMHHQGRQRPLPPNTHRGQYSSPEGTVSANGYKDHVYNLNLQHRQRQRDSKPGRHHRQQNTQQGFNFRSYNQTQGTSNSSSMPQQSSSSVNRNVMNSLKKQLKSTLKQNRNSNN